MENNSSIDIGEELERVLSLKLGEETLVLWRKNRLVNGKSSLPSEDLYRIEFNTDYQGCFSDLTLPRALTMAIDILTGIAERATHESGDYAYNKEQIMAMATMYSQVDSQVLLKSLEAIHQIESQAMEAALENKK